MVRGIFLVLALASSVWALNGSARAAEPEGSTAPDASAQQGAPDASATEVAPNTGSYQQQRAAREARRQANLERIRRLQQQTAGPAAVSGPAAPTDIQVSFKTKGVYTGDFWVSPPTFTGVQEGYFTVEARVQGLDAKRNPVDISPEWIPADPKMVMVSPSQGNAVTITVQRAGQSSLRVVSQEVSKELSVKATQRNNVLQVEIVQSGVAERPTAAPDVPALHSPAAAPPPHAPKLNSEKQKLSYALGMNLGRAIRKESVDADLDLLTQGLKDALSASQTLLTEQEMRATLVTLQGELKKTKTASQAARKTERAEKNKDDGEAFLAENKAKEGVVTLESGLQYKVLKAGDGRKPAAGDTIVAHYRGTFIDGTEFDSSYRRKQPATFPVKKVIKGWSEALQLMPVGSKWELFIPSHLAYGERGGKRGGERGGIGPNATLIFEVELISIRDDAGARVSRDMQESDTQVRAQ